MTYEFECKCGHTEAHEISMKRAPELGSKRRCGGCRGKTLARVLSRSVVVADAKLKADRKYPYVSRQWSGLPDTPQTPEGHSVIVDKQAEREVMAKTGLVRE